MKNIKFSSNQIKNEHNKKHKKIVKSNSVDLDKNNCDCKEKLYEDFFFFGRPNIVARNSSIPNNNKKIIKLTFKKHVPKRQKNLDETEKDRYNNQIKKDRNEKFKYSNMLPKADWLKCKEAYLKYKNECEIIRDKSINELNKLKKSCSKSIINEQYQIKNNIKSKDFNDNLLYEKKNLKNNININ